MSKLPRMTAVEAEKLLLKAGYTLARTKGCHRIYLKDYNRQVLPFHPGKNLHPKIVKQIIKAIEQ
ncbi:MAG: type II toxin-antitoxin system HicA family toxin [Candidatus Latescibacteria bacterium]|nr:type II toxin-antitoxin system HicA family toxin [Candidatus Latescibacterota bacterium]